MVTTEEVTTATTTADQEETPLQEATRVTRFRYLRSLKAYYYGGSVSFDIFGETLDGSEYLTSDVDPDLVVAGHLIWLADRDEHANERTRIERLRQAMKRGHFRYTQEFPGRSRSNGQCRILVLGESLDGAQYIIRRNGSPKEEFVSTREIELMDGSARGKSGRERSLVRRLREPHPIPSKFKLKES